MPGDDNSALEAVVSIIPDGVSVVDDDGRLSFINPIGAAIIGRRPEDCIGHSAAEFVHPDDLALVLSSLESCVGKDRGTQVEVRVLLPDGAWRWLEIIGRDCHAIPGVGGIVCTARDLTERRMWEVAANDVTRFQQIVQHAATIVMSLSGDGVVTSVNGAFGRILGYDPVLVVGASLAGFAASGYQSVIAQGLKMATVGAPVSIEVLMRHAERPERVPVRLELVDMRNDPVVGGVVVTGQDITELHQARLDLEHLATHDPLTGLANRTLLDAHLQSVLQLARPVSVTYLDLDDFKGVNDRLGHETGDELLRAVAGRLRGAVSAGDMVARRGGDEFVVVAQGVPTARDASVLASRLTALMAGPYQLASGGVRIGASAGTAWWSPEQAASVDAASLLAEADAAMYATKARRRQVT